MDIDKISRRVVDDFMSDNNVVEKRREGYKEVELTLEKLGIELPKTSEEEDFELFYGFEVEKVLNHIFSNIACDDSEEVYCLMRLALNEAYKKEKKYGNFNESICTVVMKDFIKKAEVLYNDCEIDG